MNSSKYERQFWSGFWHPWKIINFRNFIKWQVLKEKLDRMLDSITLWNLFEKCSSLKSSEKFQFYLKNLWNRDSVRIFSRIRTRFPTRFFLLVEYEGKISNLMVFQSTKFYFKGKIKTEKTWLRKASLTFIQLEVILKKAPLL